METVNPVIVIAAVVVVVLFVFLVAVYLRLGWENDFFGIKRRWKRHQRRKRKQPPVYGPLQHEIPADHTNSPSV